MDFNIDYVSAIVKASTDKELPLEELVEMFPGVIYEAESDRIIYRSSENPEILVFIYRDGVIVGRGNFSEYEVVSIMRSVRANIREAGFEVGELGIEEGLLVVTADFNRPINLDEVRISFRNSKRASNRHAVEFQYSKHERYAYEGTLYSNGKMILSTIEEGASIKNLIMDIYEKLEAEQCWLEMNESLATTASIGTSQTDDMISSEMAIKYRIIIRCPICNAPAPKDMNSCIYCKAPFAEY